MRRPRPHDPDRGAHIRAPDPPHLYRLRAGAGDVGTSTKTLWKAVKAGELEAFQWGDSKAVLLRPEAVRAWAESKLRPYKHSPKQERSA